MNQPSSLDDTAAIVVHYRNYEIIQSTLVSLLSQGVDPTRIVVIDNSEEPFRRDDLQKLLPNGITLLFVRNHGYGAAVNVGISHVQAEYERIRFILVATHEVAPYPGAVQRLRDALVAESTAVAAGPTLISGASEPFVWSKGGTFTKHLGLPTHYGHRDAFDEKALASETVQKREWMDGAFVLYRAEALAEQSFDETFFMYMEETELQLRLCSDGAQILWVPSAIVWQSSNGIPAYYLARNLRLYYRRTGGSLRSMAAVLYSVSRRGLSGAVKRNWEAPALIKGLLAPLPSAPTSERVRVTILNPLGGALHYYTEQLKDVLRANGGIVSVQSAVEPSIAGGSRLGWIRRYERELARAHRSVSSSPNSRLIVTWPVLGYLDIVLIRAIYRGQASIVIHDPTPLVRAVGYGAGSRWLASKFARDIEVIVHSTAALDAVNPQWSASAVTLLPLPMLPPVSGPSETLSTERFAVRVLGQYKTDRDLDAMRGIARQLDGRYNLEIYGRGWPPVAGWKLIEGYLSEEDMAATFASSDVIVIPYSRFFQSGVAVRAIENGVPAVGPKLSSLADLFGPESKLLVDLDEDHPAGSAWATSISWAATSGRKDVADLVMSSYQRVTHSWRAWLQIGDESK